MFSPGILMFDGRGLKAITDAKMTLLNFTGENKNYV